MNGLRYHHENITFNRSKNSIAIWKNLKRDSKMRKSTSNPRKSKSKVLSSKTSTYRWRGGEEEEEEEEEEGEEKKKSH
jgi:hypothetical protein